MDKRDDGVGVSLFDALLHVVDSAIFRVGILQLLVPHPYALTCPANASSKSIQDE